MPYKQQTRREVWKITEMRDGCVYKTESKGLVWVDLDKVTWDTSMHIDETLQQAFARQDLEYIANSKKVADYEKSVAQENGGDFLGSVSSGLVFAETYRSIKV